MMTRNTAQNRRYRARGRHRSRSLFRSLAISAGILYVLTHGIGAAPSQGHRPHVTSLEPGCVTLRTWQDDGSAIAQCPDGSYWTYDPDGMGGKRGHAKRHAETWSPYRGCFTLGRDGSMRRHGRDDFATCFPDVAAIAPYQERNAGDRGSGAGGA